MKNFRNILMALIVVFVSWSSLMVNAQTIDTITVWGDRWINPQGGQGGGSTPGGGGGTGGRDESSEGDQAGREEERKRICTAIATALANANCSTKVDAAPQGYRDIAIPDSYSTRLVWQDTVIGLATDLFYNNPDYLAVVGNSISAAWQRCGDASVCIDEVSRYFGISGVSLPDAIALRDGNNIFNWLRARFGAVDNNAFLNAEGGRMASKFSNGATCQALKSLKPRFRCS
jgi:hypothetical protein